MKMDFWEKTNYTDGVPETYTKQLREKKCAIFGFTCPLRNLFYFQRLKGWKKLTPFAGFASFAAMINNYGKCINDLLLKLRNMIYK